MEEAVEQLEKQMQKTDERLDNLAVQVGNIGSEFLNEEVNEVEVYTILQSVNEVKSNYQNLRKEILEVQDLQKQLSTSLQAQIKMMQSKCNVLKEKISTNVPVPRDMSPSNVPNLLIGHTTDQQRTFVEDPYDDFIVQVNYENTGVTD